MNLRSIPLIPTLIVGLAVVVMIALGFWQLGRADEKELLLAQYRAVSEDAQRIPYPETENALERGVLLCDGDTLRLSDLPPGVGRGGGPKTPAQETSLSIKLRTAQLERELIARALTQTEGNRSQAARLLEISYKALLYKIRDYGLE